MQTYKSQRILSDTLVARGSGELHSLVFGQDDAAPTAGSIIVYDNIEAGGKILFKHTFTTTAFNAYTVPLDLAFQNGLYVDFTTTADVSVIISYSALLIA